MYIIKHRSRRTHDAPDACYWVVCGMAACRSVDAAVALMFDIATADAKFLPANAL